ncbi:MAG TPA: hypothetical protein VK662_06150 [Acidothermaceae bacterium]|jgi:hypothetical protein|nr:hypothetical protein [Acidothermaceae bacterium]
MKKQMVHLVNHREQLVVRRVRRSDRIAARLLAPSLDRQLAAGRAPESTQLLATRAAQLADLETRRQLARDFDHLLESAHRPGVARSPRAVALRGSITDVEPDLRDMLITMTALLPTSARGVAMARILLTDGTGPLFNPHCSTNLRDAIHDVTAQLDLTRLDWRSSVC